MLPKLFLGALLFFSSVQARDITGEWQGTLGEFIVS
jgi:hypothetical protein